MSSAPRASKAHLRALETRIESSFETFKFEIRSDFEMFKAEMRAEFETFKAEMRSEMASFRNQVLGGQLAMFIALVALILYRT